MGGERAWSRGPASWNPVQFSKLKSLANGTSRDLKPCRQAGKKNLTSTRVRLAEGVVGPDLREKLLRHAREWMQAEMDEEGGADIEPSPVKGAVLKY
jgi:hypothetical protein